MSVLLDVIGIDEFCLLIYERLFATIKQTNS